MPNTPPQLVAGGTIRPHRFVKLDGSNDFTGLEADANDIVIGISQVGGNRPPLDDLVSTNNAAIAGETFRLFGEGDICLIEAGDTFAHGARLKSDNDGRGVAITTTGTTIQHFGARALEAATAVGQLVRAQVMIGSERPALT